MIKRLALIFSLVFYTVVFAHAKINPFQETYGRDSIQDKWVDSVLNRMSLDEKIAQLLMIRAYSNKGPEHIKSITHLIKKYKIGGLCFFQGGPVRQANLTNYYQSISKTPLLIALDAEWGLGMRLDSTISYPRQMMLGAIQDNRLLYEMGVDIAEQLKAIGTQVNFAPVVDVNNNPANPVINSRSFGELKYNVAQKGMAYMLGLQDQNVLATAKHFPGHGDTDTDSHHALPIINHSRERIDSLELVPFKQLIENGLGGIMIAHLNIPALESGVNVASTLSPNIVTNILRKDLGFGGLIVTDALDMKGVSNYFEPGDLEVRAFKAGNDILLLPQNVQKAIQKIRRAVRHGEISRAEVDRRCRKILATKFWAELDNYKNIELSTVQETINHPKYEALKHKLVENAITLLSDHQNLLPIQRPDTLNIATVLIGDTLKNAFQNTIDLYTVSTHFNIQRDAPKAAFDQLLHKLHDFDLVIVANCNTDQRPWKKFGIKPNAVEFISQLSKQNTTILDIFANPYALSRFKNLSSTAAVIMSYEDNTLTYEKSAQAIFGGTKFLGKLPISEGGFKAGTGIIRNNKIRLSYSLPETEGLNSDTLAKIESIISNAIKEKATPGAQILIAKNGSVVFQKAYGHHTYMSKRPVLNSDIYDLASITKIAATLPVLMKFYEEGKLDLNKTLGDYLPELKESNKDTLKIIDVLCHQSRLISWINYYISTFEPLDKDKPLFSKKFSKEYPYHLGNHTYLYKDFIAKEGVYAHEQSNEFPFEVASGLYMHHSFKDTIYNRITRSELREKNGYKYSDLGYYYFYKIIEEQTGEKLDQHIWKNYYQLLNAATTGYYPLHKFSKQEIVPTQNDVIFRKQLLHGHVHDPGAAMLGGVCGHAGMFSNTNDLAKLLQMYLNKGTYGGVKFLNPETIDLFSSCQNCESDNRRGIGFDKPEPDPEKIGPTCHSASLSSFGHTGFTGTMAWVDPKNQLVYIFLSNRIHPNQNNSKLIRMDIRTEIQELIYRAIVTGEQ